MIAIRRGKMGADGGLPPSKVHEPPRCDPACFVCVFVHSFVCWLAIVRIPMCLWRRYSRDSFPTASHGARISRLYAIKIVAQQHWTIALDTTYKSRLLRRENNYRSDTQGWDDCVLRNEGEIINTHELGVFVVTFLPGAVSVWRFGLFLSPAIFIQICVRSICILIPHLSE